MSERNLKERILKLLQKHHLLSAAEIVQLLEKNGSSFNKTSVYRALDQLLEIELICRHHLQKDQAMYELRESHHSHLVCQTCGKIAMTECTVDQPSKVAGFTINHHHTTFFGQCDSCRSKKQ